MKWVIKYKDGKEVYHYRHEKFNKNGEWLGNGDIMFFDTEQKAKDFLKTLDEREYDRWVDMWRGFCNEIEEIISTEERGIKNE